MEKKDLSFVDTESNSISSKLSENTILLSEIINFKQGIITGGNKKFISKEKTKISRKVLTGSNFNKYFLVWNGNYVLYDMEKLHRARTPEIFEQTEKIILRQTGSYPIATIDDEQYYTLDTVHNGILINKDFDIRYVLGLLNSQLLRYIYENSINETGKVFAQVKIIYINPLPIKVVTKEQQQEIITLVDKILAAKKQDSSTDTTEWEKLIDQKVYELYGLTPEEIAIVEGR